MMHSAPARALAVALTLGLSAPLYSEELNIVPTPPPVTVPTPPVPVPTLPPAPAPTQPAAKAPATITAYETAPVLSAKNVVPPTLFESPNYTLQENVALENFYYRIRLDSTQYGPYEIDSLDMLYVRVFEFGVLAKASSVEGGADFARGARNSIIETAKATGKTVITPVKSAKALGAAIEDTGRAAFDFVRLRKRNQPKDSFLTGEERRRSAHKLGLDPYSTNPAVLAYLDELAKARAAGSRLVDVSLSVGTFVMPFGTPVSAAITAGKYREKLGDKLDTMSPMELYRYNDKILKSFNIESDDRERFLESGDLTPKQKTEIIADLKTLDSMTDKKWFLIACTEPHPPEGLWQTQCSDILAKYNKTAEPIQWSGGSGLALQAITTSGKLLLIIPGDMLYWCEDVEKALDRSKSLTGITQREFVTTALLTGRARTEIEARGFVVRESFLYEAPEK